jgi:hypothetical protein
MEHGVDRRRLLPVLGAHIGETALGRLTNPDDGLQRLAVSLEGGSGFIGRRIRRRRCPGGCQAMQWVLRSDTKSNAIGFVRSRDLPPKQRFVLDDEDF